MSIDILSMRKFAQNENAIDVALPILAIECEATPLIDNELDAYEEAVLKLIALGLSGRGIANCLCATESLIDDVLSSLEVKKYIKHERQHPWTLTDDGQHFLDGTITERESTESQYGFMFINALKKEVLPFFHIGDIGRISLFKGEKLPLRLMAGADEAITFAPVSIKRTKLKSAYKAYNYNVKNSKKHEDGELTREEVVDLFADLESFDEESNEPEQNRHDAQSETPVLGGNLLIRALDRRPISLFLHMRIILDPTYPGGYRVESPFDFDGVDNDYFLKQIQWAERSETAYIEDELLKDFVTREICKLSPMFDPSVKDFHVFVLEKIPQLDIGKVRFLGIYENMERIYVLMKQRRLGLLEKENIVSNVSRYILEAAQNVYFQAIDRNSLNRIKNSAIGEINYCGIEAFKKQFCTYCGMESSVVDWMKQSTLMNIINRLSNTFGNSVLEKYVNMLLVKYYLGEVRIDRYLTSIDTTITYRKLDQLNQIRRKVSHDTGIPFTSEDYDYYMANVFSVVNDLLSALMEA